MTTVIGQQRSRLKHAGSGWSVMAGGSVTRVRHAGARIQPHLQMGHVPAHAATNQIYALHVPGSQPRRACELGCITEEGDMLVANQTGSCPPSMQHVGTLRFAIPNVDHTQLPKQSTELVASTCMAHRQAGNHKHNSSPTNHNKCNTTQNDISDKFTCARAPWP